MQSSSSSYSIQHKKIGAQPLSNPSVAVLRVCLKGARVRLTFRLPLPAIKDNWLPLRFECGVCENQLERKAIGLWEPTELKLPVCLKMEGSYDLMARCFLFL
jgi:hypothetical protein